jgi:hypothetical protein
MKKKIARHAAPVRHAKTVTRTPAKKADKKGFLVLLKSWMFVVMVALMLGIGAIIGGFLNQQMNAANPQVAGVSIEAQ